MRHLRLFFLCRGRLFEEEESVIRLSDSREIPENENWKPEKFLVHTPPFYFINYVWVFGCFGLGGYTVNIELKKNKPYLNQIKNSKSKSRVTMRKAGYELTPGFIC